MLGVDAEFKVKVGPPDATLAVTVLDPSREVAPHGPRATIVVLHGLGARGAWMRHTAKRFADGGYRAVLVDLRGHGRSSGEWLAYGTTESRDLVQVTNELADRGLIAGRLGVYGVSYGAATAIQWAAIDERVACVVAIAPFSTLRDVAPNVAQAILPGVSQLVTPDDLEMAVTETSRLAEADLDQEHPLAAISHVKAPVFLMHGLDDRLIPAWHSQRLRNASPHNTRLLLMPYMGHNAMWFDSEGHVAGNAMAWFERWLK
jgi:pimeloyl-ACP methyl ester carboxylesterase